MRNNGRLFVIMCIHYTLLSRIKENKNDKYIRLVEDLMFLPRVVELIRDYLSDSFYDEIEESMVLSDVQHDYNLDLSLNKISSNIGESIDKFIHRDNRDLLRDWLLRSLG